MNGWVTLITVTVTKQSTVCVHCFLKQTVNENIKATRIIMSWPFNAFISDILSRIHLFFFMSDKKNGRLNITRQKAFRLFFLISSQDF